MHSDGDIYEGSFKDGKCHGFGKQIYSNGIIQKGMWENNEFQMIE